MKNIIGKKNLLHSMKKSFAIAIGLVVLGNSMNCFAAGRHEKEIGDAKIVVESKASGAKASASTDTTSRGRLEITMKYRYTVSGSNILKSASKKGNEGSTYYFALETRPANASKVYDVSATHTIKTASFSVTYYS